MNIVSIESNMKKYDLHNKIPLNVHTFSVHVVHSPNKECTHVCPRLRTHRYPRLRTCVYTCVHKHRMCRVEVLEVLVYWYHVIPEIIQVRASGS